MNPDIRNLFRRREGGQTIIVAMIMLGLLLIIGFVFLGIINRNIQSSANLQRRSVATDLSEAGIRYAHQQLLRSELGADWRGTPTTMADIGGARTYDPDVHYLRPAARLADGTPLPYLPGGNQIDLGGPDGLGAYFRINYQNGRNLVRVRYAPSDANIFSNNPTGPLRQPGLARNYIIIESVGREGRFNPNDPTSNVTRTPRKFQAYASEAEFQQELGEMRQSQARFASVPIKRAFVSIGIIESARYVTNKYRVSRPADFGVPSNFGGVFRGTTINLNPSVEETNLPFQIGGAVPILNPNGSYTEGLPGFGSLYSNADLRVYGSLEANLNVSLGDQIAVAGEIRGDADSQLVLRTTRSAGGAWGANAAILGPNDFDSRNPNFSTFGGAIRDGAAQTDNALAPRSVPYKTPPSILDRDPQTGSNRYLTITRDSGNQVGGGNSGRFGHGRGVYIDNVTDRQTPSNEGGRQAAGADSALVYDWLNPNNDLQRSGWRGFLYAPVGAYVQLLTDGFIVVRSDNRDFRLPNGTATGRREVRYRIGRGTDRLMKIVNTLTPGMDDVRINGALSASDFDLGNPFNGVLFFEGNVRVRGVIPTDVQLTLVSNATIYIEGSITKGVTGNQFTATYSGLDGLNPTAEGTRLTRSSKSMLMLMAKDYVTLNTTQFFGPLPGTDLQPKSDQVNLAGFSPVVVRNGSSVDMNAEFILDPNGNGAVPTDPSTWRPFAAGYHVPGQPAQGIPSSILLAHSVDEGAASATFFTLDVNPSATSRYMFPATDVDTSRPAYTNLASDFYGTAMVPLYGMGSEEYERYPSFEQIPFPLIVPNQVLTTTGAMTATGATGDYTLGIQSPNAFRIVPTSVGGTPTNDYLLGRFAIVPHDIRIEASIFAEEGSFFVIPGQWFNPNPRDTWETYSQGRTPADIAADAVLKAELDEQRLESFGAYPATPFYGEPADVRIQIIGAVSENMPPPVAQQAEWMRKWGWIPREIGMTGVPIPDAHVRSIFNYEQRAWVPNLTISYDPVLATGRTNGFLPSNNPFDPASPIVRVDGEGRPLPPVPRLPVSPTLAYFGEVN